MLLDGHEKNLIKFLRNFFCQHQRIIRMVTDFLLVLYIECPPPPTCPLKWCVEINNGIPEPGLLPLVNCYTVN